MKRYPTTLIIAGSDSCGGAGIQADIKTCSAIGVYAATVVTAITAQNTKGVYHIMPVTPQAVRAQIEAVLNDLTIDSIKIGMLCNADITQIVADVLHNIDIPIVLDPVMVSTSGHKLISDDTIDIAVSRLFPKAMLITPNTHEASLLSGINVVCENDLHLAAEKLLNTGCNALLMKGGHIAREESVDFLYTRNEAPKRFSTPTIDTRNTHGTGCTLASAVAAHIAMGESLESAVKHAKTYVSKAIEAGAHIFCGHGNGSLNHSFNPMPLQELYNI